MRRTVHILIAAQLVSAIGMGLLLPVLPFFVQTRGATAVEVTQFVAIYALAGMIFSPVLGRLSDVLGRKPTLVLTTLASAGVYLAYPMIASLLGLFSLRLVSGGLEARGGVISAWLIDVTPQADRARMLGRLGAMNGVGMLTGPLLASVLLGATGERFEAVFFGGAAISLATAIALLFAPEVQRATRQGNTASSHDTRDVLALNFLIFLVFSVIFSISALYMQARFGWNASQAGLGIGTMTATVAIARAFLAHRWLEQAGTIPGTCTAALAMAVCAVLASIPEDPLLFMVFYCLSAAAYALAGIGVTVMLADQLPAASRGYGLGQLGAAGSAAIVAGSATHGYLFQHISPTAPLRIYGIAVALLVSIWIYRFANKRRPTHG